MHADREQSLKASNPFFGVVEPRLHPKTRVCPQIGNPGQHPIQVAGKRVLGANYGFSAGPA
jgi:hypothetical protein